MRVLLIKPYEEAQLTEIDGSLKSMQELVGGYIEVTYPYEDRVVLVCNDEGKLLNLTPNREIKNDEGQVTDVIFGDFFIAGDGEDDFASISDELAAKYQKQFTLREKEIDIIDDLIDKGFGEPKCVFCEASSLESAKKDTQSKER